MTCDAVMTICQVKGCGQALRRGQVQDHIATGQMRHFSLLMKDRANLLWEFMEKVTVYLVLLEWTGYCTEICPLSLELFKFLNIKVFPGEISTKCFLVSQK